MPPPAGSLRWSRHWRIGRRHFGVALYRNDEPHALDRWYVHYWTHRD